MTQGRFVIPFSQLRMTDVDIVGGKNASLGELLSQLTEAGIRVPDGFATTAEAFRVFLKEGGLDKRIELHRRQAHPIAQCIICRLRGERAAQRGAIHSPCPGSRKAITQPQSNHTLTLSHIFLSTAKPRCLNRQQGFAT